VSKKKKRWRVGAEKEPLSSFERGGRKPAQKITIEAIPPGRRDTSFQESTHRVEGIRQSSGRKEGSVNVHAKKKSERSRGNRRKRGKILRVVFTHVRTILPEGTAPKIGRGGIKYCNQKGHPSPQRGNPLSGNTRGKRLLPLPEQKRAQRQRGSLFP